MSLRRHSSAIALTLAAAAACAVTFAVVWPRPPRPSINASLGAQIESGDGSSDLGIRMFYGPPDPGAYICYVDSPLGTIEVLPPAVIRRGRTTLGPLSPELLLTHLGLPETDVGRSLAADLDAFLRDCLNPPMRRAADVPQTTSGLRARLDSGAADPGLWYEASCAVKMFPPGTRRPR
jgi:hypothetical protein